MDDNPYETPSTTATPPTDGIDTQRFHRNDYLSAGCSFVVVLPLMLFPLGGVVAMLGSHPGERLSPHRPLRPTHYRGRAYRRSRCLLTLISAP